MQNTFNQKIRTKNMRRNALPYLAILVLGFVMTAVIRLEYESDMDHAQANYRRESEAKFTAAAHTVEMTFAQIYQGLRTMALLPGVQKIDRYAENFGGDSRRAVQEIYNNTALNFPLSEIYLVPLGFVPDEIDQRTGKLQTPIVTFDELIVGRSAAIPTGAAGGRHSPRSDSLSASESLEEIEIYEYRLMKQQLSWLFEHYPTRTALEDYKSGALAYPALCGPEVIICDNSRYSPQAPNDADRSGLVYSVPFYGPDDRLKGMVSAVILTPALRDLLHQPYYAVRNIQHDYTVISGDTPDLQASRQWLAKGEPDPNRLYSQVLPLQIVDGGGKWLFGAAQPDDLFWQRPDVIHIRAFVMAGYLSSGILVLGLWTFIFVIKRYRYRIEQHNGTLTARVRERTAQLSLLNDLGKKYTSTLDPDELARLAAESIRAALHYHKVSIAYLDETNDELVWKGLANYAEAPGFRQKVGQGLIGKSVATGQTVLVNDVGKEPDYFTVYSPETRSELCVPLKIAGRVVGVINVESERLGAFDENDVRTLETLAEQLSAIISNARLFEKVSKSEQALRQSEEKYRHIINAAADAIISIDAQGAIVELNRAAEQMFGFKKVELAGKSLTSIIPVRFRDPHMAALRHYVTTGHRHLSSWQNLELPGLTKDGREIPLEISFSLFEFGEQRFFTGVLRDITARKRAEETLCKLSSVVEQTADSVLITDTRGIIEYVNPAFEKLTGYTKEEMLGKTSRILNSGKHDKQFFHKFWETILSGRTYRNVLINKKKNGELYYAEKTITPIRDTEGNLTHFVSTDKDITERKRMEQALRESEERFKAFMNNSPVVAFMKDEEGRYLYANEPFKRVFQIGPDDLLGKTDFDFFPAEIVRQLRENDAAVLAGDQPAEMMETVPTPDGAPHYWLVFKFPVKDISGRRFLGGVAVDITERKRVEDEHRKSETRLAEAQRVAHLGNWEVDLVTSEVWWSDEVYRILGFTPREFAASYEAFLKSVHPEDKEFVSKLIAEALSERKLYSFDSRIVLPDGAIRIVHTHAEVIVGEFGQPIMIVGTIQDITERKRTEQVLAKLNECFLSFGAEPFDNINHLTALCGELLGAACALYNRLDRGMLCSWGQWNTPPDFNPIDKPDGHICHDVIKRGDEEALVVRNLSETHYAQTDPNVIPYGLQTYIGRGVKIGGVCVGSLCVVYQSDFIPSDDDKKLLGIIASAIGVEERRKQAEEERARLTAIIEATTDFVAFADARGHALYLNTAGRKMLGLREDEDIRGFPIIEGYPLWAREKFQNEAIPTAMREGSWSGEAVFLSRDGREIPISQVHIVHKAPDGTVEFHSTIARDISERKRTETELREAKETADAANRAKSEFLANMSHEIRTPMNGVIGMTDLLLDTDLTAEQREYLSMVKISADSLLTIINDILDFSKIEAGKLELEHLDFDLRTSLELVVKTLAVRAANKGLRLAFHVAPEVPHTLIGDANRLRQIILNLMGNAIKFTDHGEVMVSVNTGDVDQSMTASTDHYLLTTDHCFLHFAVRDTGIGIPPEKQTIIFKAFTQADNSTTRRYGGTGLGLTISSRLVELMGGRMWVESEVGKGTTFHFTADFGLTQSPASRELANGARNEVEPKTPVRVVDEVAAGAFLDNGEDRPIAEETPRRLHVLLAEDNPVNQKLATRLLEKRGHTTTVVVNGKQVLTMLEKAHFDLILMDVQMPEMGGFEATAEIRAKEQTTGGHIPIIAVTAHAMKGDAERCLAAGMDGHIAKPIQAATLHNVIASVTALHPVATIGEPTSH